MSHTSDCNVNRSNETLVLSNATLFGEELSMTRSTIALVAVLCLLLGSVVPRLADAGTFQTGVFTQPTDLGLTPTTPIFQAVGVGAGSPVTVNGVTFSAATGQFAGAGPGTWTGGNSPTFGDANLNTLSVPYTVSFSTFGPNMTGTISGLTTGLKYRLQFVIYDGDSGNTSPGYRGHTTIVAGSDSLTNFNDETILGGRFRNKGVFVNYDFVATGATLSASLTPVNDGSATVSGTGTIVISAFDVQYLPEPTSAAMIVLSTGALALRRRRNTRSVVSALFCCLFVLSHVNSTRAAHTFSEDFNNNSFNSNNMVLTAASGSPVQSFATGAFRPDSSNSDNNRIFLRTVDSNYAVTGFRFEATVIETGNGNNPWTWGFFGMANSGNNGEPTQARLLAFTSGVLSGVNDRYGYSDNGFAGQNTVGIQEYGNYSVSGTGTVPDRLRMDYDAATQKAYFSIDANYTGVFSPEISFILDGSNDGFNATNSYLVLGGGRDIAFDDVLVLPEPSAVGVLVLAGLVGISRMSRSSRRGAMKVLLIVASIGIVGTSMPHTASAGTFATSSFTSTAGLDLSGTFVLAENTSGPAITVGGLNFTAGNTQFTNGGSVDFTGWTDPTFADPNLTSLMDSTRLQYTNPPGLTASVPVITGVSYKVQLLFWEGDPDAYNLGGREPATLSAEGDSLHPFNVTTVMGGGTFATHSGVGALVTYTYTAADSALNISLLSDGDLDGGEGVGHLSHYVFVSAVTVEALPEPSGLALLGIMGIAIARRRHR